MDIVANPPAPHVADGPEPLQRPDAAHFAAPVCRNCDAPLQTPFCSACGQARAKRFGLRAVGSEAWQSWRLFEWEVLSSAWRLVRRPGTVAREYVLGRRKRHVHPLKLLLFAIGALLLVLARGNYLDSAQAEVNRAMELVRTWSNWSFSLGIVAILVASLLIFRRRGGYNATEHLVLAVYCQFLVICASVLNKLPTLIWRGPEFLALHKACSAWYMDAVGAGILALAFTQFFALDLRRDGGRLAAAVVVFLATKWLLMRLYALLLVQIVLSHRP
jgi:hypothetical protein